MRTNNLVFLIFVFLFMHIFFLIPCRADPVNELETTLKEKIQEYDGDWQLYLEVLKNDSDAFTVKINSHKEKGASLLKLFILGAVEKSIGSDSSNTTLDQFENQMITVSDNNAANSLINYIAVLSGDEENYSKAFNVVNDFSSSLGCTDTSIGRTFNDSGTSHGSGENYTSAEDCGKILKSIYKGTCVSTSASTKMLNLLKNQQRNGKIPLGLPEGITVAHKTGELADAEHDAGIIYGTSPYILCIMSNNVPNTSAAKNGIKELTEIVHKAVSSGSITGDNSNASSLLQRLKEFFQWVVEKIIDILVSVINYLTINILDIFRSDLRGFLSLFGAQTSILSALTGVGYGIALIIFLLSVFLALFVPPSKNSQSVIVTVARFLLTACFVSYSFSICNAFVGIAYKAEKIIGIKKKIETKALIDLIDNSDMLTILIIIFLAAFTFEFFGLFLEIAERWVLLGVLTCISPVACAAFASDQTSEVFLKFFKSYISLLTVMVINIWFVRLIQVLLTNASEIVSGDFTTLFYMLTVLGVVKVAQRIDEYLNSMGLSASVIRKGMLSTVVGSLYVARSVGKMALNGGKALVGGVHKGNKTDHNKSSNLLFGKPSGSFMLNRVKADRSQAEVRGKTCADMYKKAGFPVPGKGHIVPKRCQYQDGVGVFSVKNSDGSLSSGMIASGYGAEKAKGWVQLSNNEGIPIFGKLEKNSAPFGGELPLSGKGRISLKEAYRITGNLSPEQMSKLGLNGENLSVSKFGSGYALERKDGSMVASLAFSNSKMPKGEIANNGLYELSSYKCADFDMHKSDILNDPAISAQCGGRIEPTEISGSLKTDGCMKFTNADGKQYGVYDAGRNFPGMTENDKKNVFTHKNAQLFTREL